MSRPRKALFALALLLLTAGVVEAALRLAGFRYSPITTALEFNYPRPAFLEAFFEIDPDLLYRVRRTVRQRWVDLTWQPAFDLKIRDARQFGPASGALLRVAALGDSTTYGINTELPWPARLERLLDGPEGADRAEVINLGVPGYTSFQGRRLLETRGPRLGADVVIVLFGWNDHLLALGTPDAGIRVGAPGSIAARNVLSRSRIYQALSKATAVAWRGVRRPATPSAGGPTRRVDRDAYGAELGRLIEASRALGAEIILCTYPTAFSEARRLGAGAPGWMIETHVGRGSLDDLMRLQETYNDAVRQAAAAAGVPLVDLEAEFTAADKRRLYDNPGRGDLVHPGEAGYEVIARALLPAVRAAAARR